MRSEQLHRAFSRPCSLLAWRHAQPQHVALAVIRQLQRGQLRVKKKRRHEVDVTRLSFTCRHARTQFAPVNVKQQEDKFSQYVTPQRVSV